MDQGNEHFYIAGMVKNYKGIGYKMTNLGMYQCVNLPENTKLNGMFTSPTTLHAAIDALENERRLANNKPKDQH
jgi:hypothetical protein